MGTMSTSDIRSGTKILVNGEPCSVIHNDFVKPGKGQAFNRIKFRQLRSDRVLEKTWKSGEQIEVADVHETSYRFIYQEGDVWHFMHPDTYEQVQASQSIIDPIKNYLKAEDMVDLTFYEGEVIGIKVANFVWLKVIECGPNVKGDTVSSGTKTATLESHYTLRVPLFINEGELLKIDTRTGEYVGRQTS
jgi:elongation factor P